MKSLGHDANQLLFEIFKIADSLQPTPLGTMLLRNLSQLFLVEDNVPIPSDDDCNRVFKETQKV